MVAVVAPSRRALADPPIDPYPSYSSVGNCLNPPVNQPGVVEFRSMLIERYGIGGGIFRCDSGQNYEHGQGRALDWMVNRFDPVQNAMANEVINWLMAPDAAGNPHAMARRLGLGQIIWDDTFHNFYGGYYKADYTPCTPAMYGNPAYAGTCHTNHIHFAFSWAGALRHTSWFTTSPRPAHWYPSGTLTSTFAPALGTSTEQHYFGAGSDEHLHHWYWTPSTGVGYQDWGGSYVGKVVAGATSMQQIVFGRGPDGHLRQTYWDIRNPSVYTQVDWTVQAGGPTLAGDPAAFEAGGVHHVFAAGTDGKLHHWFWSPTEGFGHQDWGGDLAGSPTEDDGDGDTEDGGDGDTSGGEP